MTADHDHKVAGTGHIRNSFSCAVAHPMTHENGAPTWAPAARRRPVPREYSIPSPVGRARLKTRLDKRHGVLYHRYMSNQVSKPDQKAEAIRKCEASYRELCRSLAEVGFIWPGTVQSKKLACGKAYCACHRDPEARHGPYWYWTSKKAGKTVSRMLTKEEAAILVPWVRNRQMVEATLKRMRQISMQTLPLLLPASPRAQRAWPELLGRKIPRKREAE